MATIQTEFSETPHGHGLFFKNGIADGVLDCCDHEETPHDTHSASYERGLVVGAELKREVAKHVMA